VEERAFDDCQLLQRLIDTLQAVVLAAQSLERTDGRCESCETLRASARRALEAAARFRDAIARGRRM
jgi:hypothetical protein